MVHKRKCVAALAGGLLLCCACNDARLARYRDDHLLDSYRYVHGELYCEVDGVKLCYQDIGTGPVVLVLPGLGSTIDYWQLTVPALAREFRVIVVDPPGFGKSGKPDAPYTLQWINERVLGLLDALEVRRAAVVGGSMGGHLGLLLALDHPERVDKLVLMGSTGAWPPPNPLLDGCIRLLWNDQIVCDYLRMHWPEIYEVMFRHPSPITERLFRYAMANRAVGRRFRPEGLASSRALRSILYSSRRSQLSKLSVPVLLIWGEHDEIHPPEDGLFMRRHMPDSRMVILPDAGHEAMVDQPEEFNRALLAFLRGGTAGVADSTIGK